MRYREGLRRLDLERQYLLNREARPMTERKKEVQNEALGQTLKDPAGSLSEANK
jgi:hypothetical protein